MSLERDLTAGIDPLGWMALADRCEERGDLAGAGRWRRRAACLRAVLELRKVAGAAAGPRGGFRRSGRGITGTPPPS